jgi:hypothetical protein
MPRSTAAPGRSAAIPSRITDSAARAPGSK